MQLACVVQEAILLIIRRSWVRAPPAPLLKVPSKALWPAGMSSSLKILAATSATMCGCVRHEAVICTLMSSDYKVDDFFRQHSRILHPDGRWLEPPENVQH